MFFSMKCTGVSTPLSTISGAEIEKSGCMPSLPWRSAAREASGKWSCILRRWMSSGMRRHCSTTCWRYLSGSLMNFSMDSWSAKTQYFSLYLKTPRLGLPGMSRPCSTMLTRQKPRKSRGMCMKSGVLLGMRRMIWLPTTCESMVCAMCSSIMRWLFAFSMYRCLPSRTRGSGRREVMSCLYSRRTLKSSFLRMERFFSSSSWE
mmetsp:Transcript_3763/g.6425  ORF Transcript_3763/g.6425 Transcript_3763/m.6425 type:complete len:204 (-) Transcript_3763:1033-1644(-)